MLFDTVYIVIVNSTKARAKNEMKENAHIQVVWSSPVAKSMYGPKHGDDERERRRKSQTCRLFNNSGVIVEQLVIVLK